MVSQAAAKKSTREQFTQRRILLCGDPQRDTALAALSNAPLDADRPLEVLIREAPKARKPDQNALMWVGPLADIAEQGYLNGRRFSADVWHEYFKLEYLPEEFDPIRCREGYRKWAYMPNGDRTLIGSTTQLTVAGFAEYLTDVQAFGGSLGVQFRASPNEHGQRGRWAE